MRRYIWLAILACSTACAQSTPDFARWWPQFQAAVAKRDAHSVARGVRFPLDWENGPKIRRIKNEVELAAHFDTYFTPEIMQQIAVGKPEMLPTGNYLLVWHARRNEYSLNFTPAAGGFALDGLGEGPP